MNKICKKCNKELDIIEFVKNKNCKDGYECTCKKCKNKIRQERYKTLQYQIPENSKKICIKCNKLLPYSRFAKDLKSKDCHRNICKSCDYERIKNRNNLNKLEQNSTWWNCKANSVNKRGRKNLPDKITGKELYDIFIKQNKKCSYCNIDISDKFQVEHIEPISNGGRNIKENICLSCEDCNRLKWNKSHKEFVMFLNEYVNRINMANPNRRLYKV